MTTVFPENSDTEKKDPAKGEVVFFDYSAAVVSLPLFSSSLRWLK